MKEESDRKKEDGKKNCTKIVSCLPFSVFLSLQKFGQENYKPSYMKTSLVQKENRKIMENGDLERNSGRLMEEKKT